MYKLVQKYAFEPPRPSYRKKSVSYIPKANGEIPYILIRAKHNPQNTTIIYTHGNAEDLGNLVEYLQMLSDHLNVNILGYDYQGYGYNGTIGDCSENACYEDIYCIYQFLIEHRGISSEQIILYGRSIGSGPSIHLAAELCKSKSKRPLGGVILQSGFKSVVSVLSPSLTWVPFMDIFTNSTKISDIKVPIFIIHGELDYIVPFEHSVELLSLTQYPTHWWISDAGHNDIESRYKDELLIRLGNFIGTLSSHHYPAVENKSCFSFLLCGAQ